MSTRAPASIVPRVESASELNKRKVRLFVEAVWNEGRVELIDELVAADYLGRVPHMENGIRGPQGVRRLPAGANPVHRGNASTPHTRCEPTKAGDRCR